MNKLTPDEYLLLMIKRTREIGHLKLNAVTEELYAEALEKVKELSPIDSNIKTPLRGIPVSIKDCIAQENCDATCGAAARCFR
jgi:Asp-tRNA(Asn)/Glu-tRNA(Gln) amidotransferase A subunit family amidase